MVGTPLNELWKVKGKAFADKFAKIFLIFLAIALAISMAAGNVSAEPIRLTPIETYDVNYSGTVNITTPITPIVLKPILVNTSELNVSDLNVSVPDIKANISPIKNISKNITENVSEEKVNITISDTYGIYPAKDAKVEGDSIIVGKNVTWITTAYGDKIVIPQVAFGLILPEVDNDAKITSGRLNLTIAELRTNMEKISKINALESELSALKSKRTRQNILGRAFVDMNSISIENSINEEKQNLLNLTEAITIRFKTNASRTVYYETEAPKKIETNITNFRKYVNISSIMHYTNVTAYTDLVNEVPKNKLEIYWIINGTRVPFRSPEHNIRFIDSDFDGLIERIEWVVPHLSSQVFEIITRMSAVYDMDESKNPLADIYSLVKTKDNVTAEIIDTHHIGITFEKMLDNTRKIILYANSSSTNTTLFLYDGSKDAIAVLRNVSAYGRYELSLENMSSEIDQFYIKIVNGTLYVDYITAYPPAGNVSIWDDTNDAKGKNDTYYENEVTGFYANMTNGTGYPLNDSTSSCRIAFNISGSWTSFANMTYNSSSELYEYFTSFSRAGSFNYNISCNSSSGSSMVTDDFKINMSMPDYTIARIMSYNSTTSIYNISIVITSRTSHRYSLKVYDYLEKGLLGENYTLVPDLTGNYTEGMYDGRYAIWILPLDAYENKTISYVARINSTIARIDAIFGMG